MSSLKHSSTSTQSGLSRKDSSISSVSSAFLKRVESNHTTEWVKEVLRKYVSKYVRDFLAQRKDTVPSPVTSWISLSDGNGNGGRMEGAGEEIPPTNDENPERNMDIDLYPGTQPGSRTTPVGTAVNKMRLNQRHAKTSPNISTLTIVEETALGDDRITYLSRIISLGVKYSIGSQSDHLVNWLVKLPSLNFDERNLARVTNVHRREVHFYSVILQDIKLWLESNDPTDGNQSFTLNVPSCYYAFHQDSSDFDIDQDSDLPNSEFTLVLEDLRAQGFGKRHFGVGLAVEEACEVIREIAKFHVTSFALIRAKGSDRAVLDAWPQVLIWIDLYDLYLDMIRQGFNNLRRFNRAYICEKSLTELVDALLLLEPKLPEILQNLLRPLAPPALTTLVHMDLWTDNLLFREDTGNEGANSSDGGQTKEIDCMILDWQMVSLGRITHDLGILMMTSLDGTVRRNHGLELLRVYYDTIQELAAGFKLKIPLEFSDLLEEYKDSCLLATLLTVGRFDLVVSEQSTMERFFEALEDLRDEQFI